MSRPADRAVAAGFTAGWWLVAALPPALALGAFRVGADLAARRDGPGARRLRANLARVVPGASPAELDVLVRDGLRSYARYWCEAFRLPSMNPAEIHDRTQPHVSGAEPVFAALAAGRGVVLALPHSGNWDAAGVWLVEELRRRGHEPVFTTVAERLRPESLYRRFVDYRAGLGFEVVAADDGAAAYRALTARLRAGGVVCLVADRDLSGSGIPVRFFGEPTGFPAGPARLAALTGASLVPAFPAFVPDGWALQLGEPIPVRDRSAVTAATQALADAFAAGIAASPAQWHALQPIWTADRVRAAVPR